MGVKRRDHMKEITKEALLEALKLRDTGEHPAFRECEFKDMDLSGADLHNMHCLTGIPCMVRIFRMRI